MLYKLPNPTREFASATSQQAGAALLRDLFELNERVGKAEFLPALADFIGHWVPYNSISLFEFAKNMQPRMLYSLGEKFDHEMTQYLGGLYLIDPLYELFERDNRRGVFRFNLEGRDEYNVPEIFVRYWTQVPGRDEIGILAPLADEERCVHVSIYLSMSEADTVAAIRFIEACFEPFTRMFVRHLGPIDESGPSKDGQRLRVHEAVSRIMADFGRDVLTTREKEIAQLLLKGHSAKSIARLLDISPGTAAIHRSNIYNKLQMSGQGEMFANFVARLVSI